MTLAAEFPNDNPDLHEGTIWVCLDVTGLPSAERRPVLAVAPAASEPEPEPEPALAEVALEPEAPTRMEAPEPRPSGIFVIESFSSLEGDDDEDDEAEIVVEELAPLEAEAVIEEIVVAAEPQPEPEPAHEPVATLAPPPPDDPWTVFLSALSDVAIAQGAPAAAADLPAKLAGDPTAHAWSAILRGTSEDWDAIGGSMLDEWAAELLATAIGADAQVVKRELRARGVAAFGLAA